MRSIRITEPFDTIVIKIILLQLINKNIMIDCVERFFKDITLRVQLYNHYQYHCTSRQLHSGVQMRCYVRAYTLTGSCTIYHCMEVI